MSICHIVGNHMSRLICYGLHLGLSYRINILQCLKDSDMLCDISQSLFMLRACSCRKLYNHIFLYCFRFRKWPMFWSISQKIMDVFLREVYIRHRDEKVQD